MDKSSRIYVSGHSGMVGSAICRRLEADGYTNIIVRTSKELDLRDQAKVREFFRSESPEYVFLAAGTVGGILANNTYRADFIYNNLMIEANVINSSFESGVHKLLFLGSSCIYPKLAPQPLKEEYLLSGYLEKTNQPYALAKICGVELCEAYRAQHGCNFISAMPTNLYGPNDHYDLNASHVLPAMLRKFHIAKVSGERSVNVWGSGEPRREFLHADDLAEALLFLMDVYHESGTINVGVGEDVSIAELAGLVKKIVGFDGEIIYDRSKPDGTPRKLLDVSRINALGWKARRTLYEGIADVYRVVKDVLN